MFQKTEWELSNLTASPERKFSQLSEGWHHLHIKTAEFDPETSTYRLKLESLDREFESSEFRYFLKSRDGTVNNRAVGTLNTLTFALTGENAGILAPVDIVNGIVLAEVKLGTPREVNGEMRQYPVIYKFEPISEAELVEAADYVPIIDQYAVE